MKAASNTPTLTMRRKGEVDCTLTHAYQCKAIGHRKYWYRCKIVAAAKLDKQGFIIDHLDVHRQIRDVFMNTSGSCEQLAIQCAKNVSGLCYGHGADVREVRIRVGPVGSDAASMEATITNT